MKNIKFLLILMVLVTAVTVACGGNTAEIEPVNDNGGVKKTDHAGAVPNEGRVVRIVSPVTGDTFAEGAEIELVVEFENFDLNDEGNHWHYYVDGGGQTMIMDGFDRRIRDLAVGEHIIDVFISGSNHKEFETGARVIINVE